MKELTEKIKPYTLMIGWVISIIGFLWMIFNDYNKLAEDLKIIQKSTLRNTIWTEKLAFGFYN